jgi:hypothetical protein
MDEMNDYKIGNDFADNIMDLKNNTFIGGARVCNIIDNIDINKYTALFNKKKEYIVPILVYTIFIEFDEAINFYGVYNFNNTNKSFNNDKITNDAELQKSRFYNHWERRIRRDLQTRLLKT